MTQNLRTVKALMAGVRRVSESSSCTTSGKHRKRRLVRGTTRATAGSMARIFMASACASPRMQSFTNLSVSTNTSSVSAKMSTSVISPAMTTMWVAQAVARRQRAGLENQSWAPSSSSALMCVYASTASTMLGSPEAPERVPRRESVRMMPTEAWRSTGACSVLMPASVSIAGAGVAAASVPTSEPLAAERPGRQQHSAATRPRRAAAPSSAAWACSALRADS
mmetsp:Transcript_14076/g.37875  ORF Transcript_14076/g.37875 Transcript_14076/m.37875 type:complete len:223 (-) Transcript_14076:695-1363(-)